MSDSTQGTIFDRLASVPLLTGGFRPFFLLAAAWAAMAVPLWLSMRAGVMVPFHDHCGIGRCAAGGDRKSS